MNFPTSVPIPKFAGCTMNIRSIAGFLIAALWAASSAAAAEKPKLYTNQSYVEDVNNRAALPIGDAKATFGWKPRHATTAK